MERVRLCGGRERSLGECRQKVAVFHRLGRNYECSEGRRLRNRGVRCRGQVNKMLRVESGRDVTDQHCKLRTRNYVDGPASLNIQTATLHNDRNSILIDAYEHHRAQVSLHIT